MATRIVVVQCTDAFDRLWDEIGHRLDVEIVRVDDAAEASTVRGQVNILACGGREGYAVEHVHEALRAGIEAPIVVGAVPDHRLAVQLMRAGAGGFFALPGDAPALESELEAIVSRPSRVAGEQVDAFDFSEIIGEHPTLKAALDRAARVIPGGRTTVLILGETGTGKELIAQAIHRNGPRAHEPFVAVNCSAIPGTLLESELFGHQKGAFTDARSSKPGLFELANRGTIFLDEVSSMPLELQAKLLRFLETREVRRLGGLKSRTVDVRILAAANEDLQELSSRGEFREDLYYRLAVIPIRLPPLRDRGDDVVRLARHFLASLAIVYGPSTPRLSAEAIAALQRHRWPGNIRELRNAIERGLLLAGDGPVGPEDLALDPDGAGTRRGKTASQPGDSLPFPATLEALESAAAAATVELFAGNKSRAARELGITRSRLYRILDRGRPEEI